MKNELSKAGCSRRQWLRRAASFASGIAAAPLVIPASALGRNGAAAPSERITLGFIGVGMMGRGHVRVCLGFDETQVLAVCDVDQWRREDAKATVEEAYAIRTPSGRYRGCAAYNDLRDLLARQDIDAVMIATGDRWHALASVLAAKAGKDIYCEKPMTLTIREAQVMVDVVRRYDRVFQTGLQQRSTAEFRKACELVRGGRIGKVRYVYVVFPGTCGDVNLPAEPTPKDLDWDLWLGPAPWHPFHNRFHKYRKPKHVVPWDFCRDFGGGNLTSNAVHAFDVVQWGLGMDESGPVEIIPPESGQYPDLTYKYASGTLLQVVNEKLDPAQHFVPKGWDTNTRIQNFGAVYVGDDGWIHVGREGYLTSYPQEILASIRQQPVDRRTVDNHHQDWLTCIRSRQRAVCDVAIGCRSTTVSHLGCIAHWTGRPLRWDPEQQEFLNDQEANRLRSRAMREPWTL